jgi:segregation and condensation protein B
MSPDAKLEALLFAEAEPVTIKKIATWLSLSEAEVEAAAAALAKNLAGRGLTLLRSGNELALGTASSAGEFLKKIAKSRLTAELGKAGLETVAIIAYRGPISRPEIDWVRGVNSSFILRQLLIRGLVKRELKTGDSRTYVYEPTIDLLAHLGVSRLEDLPEYQAINANNEA